MPLQLTFKDGSVQTVPFDSSATLSVQVTVLDDERELRQRTLAWSDIVDLGIVADPGGVEVEPVGIEPVDAATSAPQKPRTATQKPKEA